jgi:hypothetical protein
MGIIFKAKSDHSKYDNSLLYQYILRYPVEHNYADGFKFNELANWLIKNYPEFSEYYTGSRANTPKSARIANRSHRIQGCIDNLIKLGIMREKSTVKAEKKSDRYSILRFYNGRLSSCMDYGSSETR